MRCTWLTISSSSSLNFDVASFPVASQQVAQKCVLREENRTFLVLIVAINARTMRIYESKRHSCLEALATQTISFTSRHFEAASPPRSNRASGAEMLSV